MPFFINSQDLSIYQNHKQWILDGYKIDEPYSKTMTTLATNVKDVYVASSGYTNPPTASDFGIWGIVPVGDALYLGIAATAPAINNGAMLGIFQGNALSPVLNAGNVNPIQEQGWSSMIFSGGQLIIGGCDPLGSWTIGNFYTHIPGSTEIKTINPPNAIHIWQVYVDQGVIYLAGCKNINNGGRASIWRSADGRTTWQTQKIGKGVWAMDIIRWGTQWMTNKDSKALQTSSSWDGPWTNVKNITPGGAKMTVFKDKLIDFDATTLFVIDRAQNAQTMAITGMTIVNATATGQPNGNPIPNLAI